jgi:hypothetical protein
MFPFGARLTTPPPLPRPVPPFPGETTLSYLHRLAAANQIRTSDLQAHLAGTREPAPVSIDALAAATGRSPQSLARALPELRPGFDPAADAHIRRTVCWRCAARRGAFRFAVTWKPAEVNLCPSHPVWLGPPVRNVHGLQHDVGSAPEIIRAQGHHRRLAREAGRRAAAAAFAEAAPITALWARHGLHRDRRPLVHAVTGRRPLTGRLQPGDPLIPVVTYPESVALARVLAMPRWRQPPDAAADDELRQFRLAVDHLLGIHYQPEGGPYDPLYRWFRKAGGTGNSSDLPQLQRDNRLPGQVSPI